jgi:hypothetical protein
MNPTLEPSATSSSNPAVSTEPITSRNPTGSPISPVPSSTPTTPVPSNFPSSGPSVSPSSLPSGGPTGSSSIVYGLQADCKIEDTNKFNICLDLKSTGGNFETWMQSFGEAKDRWEQVIVQDDGQPINIKSNLPAEYIATKVPDLVDDVYIAGVEERIDGRGKVLGSAGPILARRVNGKYRALSGFMKFDEEDIEWMIAEGLWKGVIIHEMGHVLGIGTLWALNKLHKEKTDEYKGKFAKEEWKKLGCSGKLPVETDGGPGTAFGHWDEECLNQELMTGYVDSDMRLSVLTVASLEDMGYGVDYSAADPYDISMLDNCGKYCPAARRQLRVGRQAHPAKKKKKPISDKGLNNTLKKAAQDLKKAREQHDPNELTDDNILFVGGDLITVYYQEGDDIYDVTVSWDEAEKYLEVSDEA